MRRTLWIAPLFLLAACAPATVGSRMLMDADAPGAPESVARRERRISIPAEPFPGGKTPQTMDSDARPQSAIDSGKQVEPQPLPEEPEPPA